MKEQTPPLHSQQLYTAAVTQEESKAGSQRLLQDDILKRLFFPASNLPKSHNAHSIVLVSSGTERAVTRAQQEQLFRNALEKLSKQNLSAGDKVVFFCENSPEFSASILACWALNVMVALVDYRSERKDVLAMCEKFGAKILITSKTRFSDFESETKAFKEKGLQVIDLTYLEESLNKDSGAQFQIDSLELDKPAFAILTSGTTGNPKTAVHTLRSLVQNISDLAAKTDLNVDMTALMPLPMSHIFGLSVFLVTQVLGLKTVLTKLDPVGFIKAVHNHKPELIAALPQFYGALMAAPKGAINLDNSRLLLCGGAPLTVALAEKFEEMFGKKLNNGYGSTECKIVALNIDGPALSVGKAVGDVKIDVVNEQDETLPDGLNGEVRVTSSTMMEGYLDNEEETKKVLRNGKYYTGDIGRLQDGNLFVVGRKGDVIFVGGVVVLAGEIEEQLRNNREVKDVAVTAIPNKRLGQIVKASVVLLDDKLDEKLKSSDPNVVRETKRELEQKFKQFCKENLPRFKRPMTWEFLGPHDNLPKTLAGKTDKKSMSSKEGH